jgi:hypothetical protein
MIERRDGRTRRLPIPDRTGQILAIMTAAGLVIAVICILAPVFVRSLFSSEKNEKQGDSHGA